MRVCIFCVLVVIFQLGLLLGFTLSDNCPVQLSHDSLLVEYGQSFEVNCSLTTTPTGPYILGWEVSSNQVDPVKKTSLVWKVHNLTLWDVNNNNVFCYLSKKTSPCRKNLTLTLYKRPDSVMIHPEPGDWSENESRKLICEIYGVGPVGALTVQWTRVDQDNHTRTIYKNSNFSISGGELNVTDTMEINTSYFEDGVQYQCAALLNLTQLKQQQVGVSQLFNVTVLYKPVITQPSAATVSKTVGDSLVLNCLARGNPDPQYTWTTGGLNITNSSFLNISNIQPEHQGTYTCIASNSKGSASVTVTVTVSEEPLLIIASCVVVAVALLIVGLCVWYFMHYRHTHMGHYILKNLTSRRHNANVAHCDMDQREL